MADPKSVLLIGAGGRTGGAILEGLSGRGLCVTATFRTDRPGLQSTIAQSGARPVLANVNRASQIRALISSHETVIFAAPLRVCPPAARFLHPAQPCVFISSNNVTIAAEAPSYQIMAQAEHAVRQAAPQAVLLRPTLIYGGPVEQTLLDWMRAIRRYPILLRPWTGALQQPIFYRDLAAVAIRAACESGWAGRTIAVAGPDRVTQAELFSALCRAAGVRRPMLPIPIPLALLAARLGERAGLLPPSLQKRLRQLHHDKTPRGADVLVTETPLQIGLQDLGARL